jgi:hypothetical protein
MSGELAYDPSGGEALRSLVETPVDSDGRHDGGHHFY